MVVVGIDLAGSEKRETGFCILDKDLNAKVFTLFSDKEIINAVKSAKPLVVAIDAPLALPKGRKSLNKRGKPHLRQCDKELLELGIKFFPVTLGPMRKLTERGIRLKKTLEKIGFRVIETYPGAAQDILKIPRKQKNIKKLLNGLKKQGIKGLHSKLSGDELDAVTCALVAEMYLKGNYSALGSEDEVLMILPKINPLALLLI
ncbi:MAG: DUF429 domain-containing protein [Candidatus Aenigmarchaeota archaeon]|nr:DUF429 domain-containing protein [Candidatus Aenigmarchaeota archaeon]